MTDIYADARIVAQRHCEEGAAEERAKIVEWLSKWGMFRNVGKLIEAKEHLK